MQFRNSLRLPSWHAGRTLGLTSGGAGAARHWDNRRIPCVRGRGRCSLSCPGCRRPTCPGRRPCRARSPWRCRCGRPWSGGSLEWQLFTREVERVWTPYGVTFCWAEGPRGCEGVEARVRVLIADDLPASAVRETARQPVVGRITFHADAPGSDIVLSVTSRTPSRRPRDAGRPADLRVAGGDCRALDSARHGPRTGARDRSLPAGHA